MATGCNDPSEIPARFGSRQFEMFNRYLGRMENLALYTSSKGMRMAFGASPAQFSTFRTELLSGGSDNGFTPMVPVPREDSDAWEVVE